MNGKYDHPGEGAAGHAIEGGQQRGSLSGVFCRALRRNFHLMPPGNAKDFLHMTFVTAALNWGTTTALCDDPFFLLFQFPDGTHARVTFQDVRANYEPTSCELNLKPARDPVMDILGILGETGTLGTGKTLAAGPSGIC